MKEFEEAVNQALKDGWELAGNLAVSCDYRPYGNYYNFFQAMTRKKNK